MISRRRIVIALGTGALAVPFASFAQQQRKVWRIGVLWERAQSDYSPSLEAFKGGMRGLGYAEGKDYAIEQRSAQNDLAHLPALMAELLALKVNLIMVSGTPSAIAANNATRDLPILIVTVSDPIVIGLARSFLRPGGNVTGLTQDVGQDLGTKRLDLLTEIVPGMRRVGFLYNPENPTNLLILRQFEVDCGKLGLIPILTTIRNGDEVEAAFKILRRDRAQGLIVSAGSTTTAFQDRIVEQAEKNRLPAVYAATAYTGLITYGVNRDDLYRRVATYVDKIFKGAKPSDLPIEQPTKFDLVVNMKAAKALGLTIPNSILVQATKVVE